MARKSTVKKEVKRKICTKCNKDKKITDFYNSKNPMFIDGKVPICKECIKKMINIEEIDTIYKFLKSVNLVFDINIWNSCLECDGKKDKIGEYMRRINSMPQYKDLTWNDSVFEIHEDIDEVSNSKEEQEIIYEENKDEEPFIVTKEMVQRWGKGHTLDEYEYVEYCYNQWRTKKGNSVDDLSQETYFQMLAYKQLEIRIARENGDSTKVLDEALLKIMNDADLALKNKKDRFVNQDLVDIIDDWERYDPVDYFKDKPLFEDFDNIDSYIERHMKRPMKNTLIGTREFDGEYTIEEIPEKPKRKRKSKKKVE